MIPEFLVDCKQYEASRKAWRGLKIIKTNGCFETFSIWSRLWTRVYVAHDTTSNQISNSTSKQRLTAVFIYDKARIVQRGRGRRSTKRQNDYFKTQLTTTFIDTPNYSNLNLRLPWLELRRKRLERSFLAFHHSSLDSSTKSSYCGRSLFWWMDGKIRILYFYKFVSGREELKEIFPPSQKLLQINGIQKGHEKGKKKTKD